MKIFKGFKEALIILSIRFLIDLVACIIWIIIWIPILVLLGIFQH